MTDDANAIQVQGALWMTVGGANLGGPGRMDLLAKIAECGSITRAAKAIGMSYKAAWDAIDAMNNLAGEALVERLTGGKGGGGTRLTARGARLVANFGLIEQAHRNFVAQLNVQAGGVTDDYLLMSRMHMKTSARNQFLGRVSAIKPGAVNDEVVLEIAGANKIVATITRESTIALGLAPGVQAFALIKSSWIIVVTGEGGNYSARNRLDGTVARLQTGAVNTEVVIELDGGGTLAAMVSNDSIDALGLAVGARAAGIFKASSVILGTPA